MSVHSETLLSIESAAGHLDVSPYTVRRMIARGDLKAVRIGRLIRIKPSDLERAMRPVTVLAGNA